MSRKLFGSGLAGEEPATPPSDPFWWMHDQDALVRRFVLAEVLAKPPGMRKRRGPPPRPAAAAPKQEEG